MKAEPDTRLEKGVDVKVSLETYSQAFKLTIPLGNSDFLEIVYRKLITIVPDRFSLVASSISFERYLDIISKWDGELEGLRFCGVTPNCYVRSRGPQSRGQEDNEGKDESERSLAHTHLALCSLNGRRGPTGKIGQRPMSPATSFSPVSPAL
jgi:hypothetical protein